MTPVTNKFFKKEEHRGQKNNQIGTKYIFTGNSFRVFLYIRDPWKKCFLYIEGKQIFDHV